MSYLIMRRGPDQGKIYQLESDEVKLGRGSKNDIIIRDNDVSRDHLQFIRTVDGYELHNLSETTGTYVNGQFVDGIWLLQSECIIELGDTITLEYHLGEPPDKTDTSEVGEPDARVPATTQSYLMVTITSHTEPAAYPLDGKEIRVGRSTANDIVIVEPEMSRHHFTLKLTNDGFTIEDLGSTNGTLVNGETVEEPRLLYTGDVIQIGTTVQLQVTNTPERFASVLRTETLIDTSSVTEASRKRKTSQAEVAGLIQGANPEPTNIGTGVDHTTLEGQVLVSYAREDWEKIVAPLVDRLYDDGIEAWVDQYLIENSNDWLVATEQARLECWLLVVVVSPQAMKSDLVRKNWRHFQNREKPIILLIHEPVERMPIGAKKLVRVQYNPGVPEVAFQQIIDEIDRLQS